jgi:hypothetical protein
LPLATPIHQDPNPTLTMLLLLNPLHLAGMLFVAFGAAGPLVAAADATTMVSPNFHTEEELDHRNLSSRNLKTSKKGSKESKISKSAKSDPTTPPTVTGLCGRSRIDRCVRHKSRRRE